MSKGKATGTGAWKVGKVVSVSVRGHRVGLARIVISSPGARSVALEVKVLPADQVREVESVALALKGSTPKRAAGKAIRVRAGGAVEFKAKVSPAGAARTVAVWKSSDPSVAKVDRVGRVKAVGPGKVTITCRVNGKSASAKLTVLR
jgi:hypothetical protein